MTHERVQALAQQWISSIESNKPTVQAQIEHAMIFCIRSQIQWMRITTPGVEDAVVHEMKQRMGRWLVTWKPQVGKFSTYALLCTGGLIASTVFRAREIHKRA